MQLLELEKGLFGYKKNQVHHYIDKLNAEFSERISKLETQYCEQIAELERENAELGKALESSETENRGYHDSYHTIADSIMDARLYADREKSETARREKEAREELKRAYEDGRKQAQSYLGAVKECRRQIALQLAAIDDDLVKSQRRVADLLCRGDKDTADVMDYPMMQQDDISGQTPDAVREELAQPAAADADRLFLFRRNGEKNA